MSRYLVSKNRVDDLQTMISKMPLRICLKAVLPEFGIQWKDVTRAVRNARLPMTPTSVAKIISRHAATTCTNEHITEIVSKLRLKLVVTQRRTWHVIKLLEPILNEPVNVLLREFPHRVVEAIRSSKTNQNGRPEVQSAKMGDLIYISIQIVSDRRNGAVFYVAYPPGEPVALVSSLHAGPLQHCVLGLGYNKFQDACLNGRDIYSLLRIIKNGFTELPDHLAGLQEYQDGPCLVRGGIDFTGRTAAERFAARALGPAPPILTKLTLTTEKAFFNPDIFNKKMKIKIQLNCDDVAGTLHSWTTRDALDPSSELFRTFYQSKTNTICINTCSDDE